MDMKSAFSAAAALVLVVAGGATALSAAQTPLTSTSEVESATQETVVATTVVTEYVDEFGNPVAAPGNTPIEVRTFNTTDEAAAAPAEPEIIWIDAPTPVAAQTGFATPSTSGQYEDSDGGDDQYEDDDEYEHEDHDEDEDEDEDEEHEEHEDD